MGAGIKSCGTSRHNDLVMSWSPFCVRGTCGNTGLHVKGKVT